MSSTMIRPESFPDLAQRAAQMYSLEEQSTDYFGGSFDPETSAETGSSTSYTGLAIRATFRDNYLTFSRTAAAALLLSAVSSRDEDIPSLPEVGIEQISELAIRNQVSAAREEPVVKCTWSRHRHRIRKAARQYSENLDADYSAK